jgi:ABC-type multidrug transport system fused ATPase/permease subunit
MPSKPLNRKKSSPSNRKSRSVNVERLIHEEVNDAVNSLFTRIRAIDSYSKQFEESDRRIDHLIQEAFTESSQAHRLAKFLHVVNYFAALLTLVAGLYLAFFQTQNGNVSLPATICILGGTIGLLYLHNHNPTKKLDKWVRHLSTLTYAYLGFTHQLHLIDKAFERAISARTDVDPAWFNETLQQIQDITDEATGTIARILGEIDD